MMQYVHQLTGCAPLPLAHYLKAIGILRIVGEQADCDARGWWEEGHFCLATRLSRGDLVTFFLKQYAPTPLLSPWNKGCGFFKAGDPGLSPLEQSSAPRFRRFREGVAAARQLLDAIEGADSTVRAIKARTKTNRTFQTREQRVHLRGSTAYRTCLNDLKILLDKPALSELDRQLLRSDVDTVEMIAAEPNQPPTKSEVDRLKRSGGYKKLLAAAEREFKALKAALIPDCRRLWRGPHAEWMSAAVVLDEAGLPNWPSLLGTGGNDGNLDFTNNFMQQLGQILEVETEQGQPREGAEALLANALWSAPSNGLTSGSVGQYLPGSAGGANSSTGFDSGNLVNSWDFVLMMEGTIVFSARATRRLAPEESLRASSPFTVRSHASGYSSPGAEKAQRGEQWMPIWSRPATKGEVAALFSEGKVQLGRQTANRPIDAARAISRLGVARGIDSFTRFGFLERNGQSTLAVALGRIDVPQRTDKYARLVDDLAPWLDRLQRTAREKTSSTRLVQAERQLADAVFNALTHDHTQERWQAILRAGVAMEYIQAGGTAVKAGPMPQLRPQWVAAINDNSAEFRLALALGSSAAGYSRIGKVIDPIRHHWLPLEPSLRQFAISDKRLQRDPRVVMYGRDLLTDCAAVVQRRLIEAEQTAQRRLPMIAADGCAARLSDLAIFLAGNIDFAKLHDLSRACMAIDWNKWDPEFAPLCVQVDAQPDESWLMLRLACLPWRMSSSLSIPAEPGLVRRLIAGDSCGALEIARRRLRSAGMRAPLQLGFCGADTVRLWAAALAFPIDHGSAWRAAKTLDPALKGSDDA
jgi:CRISPR-associated protein Csx17